MATSVDSRSSHGVVSLSVCGSESCRPLSKTQQSWELGMLTFSSANEIPTRTQCVFVGQ